METDRQQPDAQGQLVNPNYDPDDELLDRPYIKIIEEHQSLAPIVDL